MRRTLCIWFPSLPLDRRVRLGDPQTDGPFAIIAELKNTWRLTHVNELARQSGVAPGMSLADARAICPDLLTEPQDPMREGVLLSALQRWADVLSPWVAPIKPDGLYLDISGCAHLFGGEKKMAQEAAARLSDMQINARFGVADTKSAAHALAHFGEAPIAIAPHSKTRDALSVLPITALQLAEQTVHELARTGVKTIGELYTIKSSELGRRFGLDVIRALGLSIGSEPDPVTPAAADPVYAARMTLPDPIGFTSDMTAVLEKLAKSVCRRLKNDQKGARAFRLIIHCVDTGDHVISVGFSKPCATLGLVLQQFAHPLDKVTIEFGADWFRLIASDIEPLHPRQGELGERLKEKHATERLKTTLSNRLGADRVHEFKAHESHLPEREFTHVEALDRRDASVWEKAPRIRPLRQYRVAERLRALEPGRPPLKFQWRRDTYTTKLANGPERLTPEWWRKDTMRMRDYWTVQTKEGLRLWLLTHPGEDPPQWYVAGKFS